MILYYSNDEHTKTLSAESALRAAEIQFARIVPNSGDPWPLRFSDADWPAVENVLRERGLLPKSVEVITARVAAHR